MGSMGSGKSTLIEYIKDHQKELEIILGQPIVTFSEYLDPIWRNNFYRDRKLHTQGFEFNALNGRIGRHFEAREFPGIAFFDRGMIEGAETFALNSYEEGFFRREHFQRYKDQLYNALDDLDRTVAQTWLESVVIYLEVEDTKVLKERCDRRADEQRLEKIPLEYLHRMNTVRYPQLVNHLPKIYREKYQVPTPRILKINASIDVRDCPQYLAETIDLVLTEIKRG